MIAPRSELSPELRLLLLLARPVLEPAAAGRARNLLRAAFDWQAFERLADRHALAPLVAGHLSTLDEEVPGGAALRLRQARLRNATRVLARTAQLLEALSAFGERGITAVPYKGPALGAQLYGSGALRRAGDLDVVVRPRDVPEARAALTGLGYDARHPMDGAGVRFMLRHRYSEEFLRADGGHVELHWAFTNLDFPFALDLDEVFGRLGSVELAGRPVPAFHPEDLLPILCVHGAKHRWERLEWLAGTAELAAALPEPAWERILGRASRLGVRRTLFLGLRLASDLLAAPLPRAVLARVRGDEGAGELAAQVGDLLASGEPAGWEVGDRVERDRFRLRLRERWRDRARFVWHRSITPSDPEQWEVARIGRWTVPLHAFRRPFHLAGQLRAALRAL